jgi:hypothetical protein
MAFKRWEAALTRWPLATLQGASRRYLDRPDVRKEEFRYCCLAEVFLNGKLDAAVEAFLEHGGENELSESQKRRYFEVTGRWREEWGARPSDLSRGS